MPSDRPRRVAQVAIIATALAVPAEGLRQWAYYDPPGILTACRGHTGPDVQKGVFYSLEQCDAWLSQDMRKAVEQVEKCHPNLPQNVHAAFADAVFNLGPTVACDSTASRYLQAGDYDAACRQLPRWNKARVAGVLVPLPGLTKRRAKEMELCLG